MLACAILAFAGGVLAWLTISNDVLETAPGTDGDTPDRAATDFSCGVAGTPLRPAREARCAPLDEGKLPRVAVPVRGVRRRGLRAWAPDGNARSPP